MRVDRWWRGGECRATGITIPVDQARAAPRTTGEGGRAMTGGGSVKVRTLVIASLAALLLPLLIGGVFVLGVVAQLPASHQARVEGPHGVDGVAASSYAWVVPAGEGRVVIVDAGQDPDARAIATEVGGREVLGILLTHAHADTIAGIDAYPDVPVFVGPGDEQLLKGEVEPKGWMAAWLARSLPRPRLPEEIREVEDGEVVELGSARFRAVHLPGHTPGSVAWVWRDVVFVGDALLVKPQMMTMMAAFSDDEEQARESLKRLLDVDFQYAADARGGLVSDARSTLVGFLGEGAPEPTIRMRDAAEVYEEASLQRGEPVVLHGVIRVDPWGLARDPSTAPELVTDDGRIYRLPSDGRTSTGEAIAWTTLFNRPATVRGRPVRWPLGVAADPRPLLEVDEVERDRDTSASEGAVERLDPTAWRRGQWVELVGPLERIAPLSEGATWGEATVGGAAGAVPLELVEGRTGQVITVLGDVVQGGADPRFSARAICLGDQPGCGVRVPSLADLPEPGPAL